MVLVMERPCGCHAAQGRACHVTSRAGRQAPATPVGVALGQRGTRVEVA